MHTDWQGWVFLGGLAVCLVAAWLLIERLTARDHATMLRNLRILRSRTPGGSTSPDECHPPAPSGDRVGVERNFPRAGSHAAAPPAPSTPVDATVDPRPAASTGVHRVTVHG